MDILLHGQMGEQPAALGNPAYAHSGNFKRWAARDRDGIETDLSRPRAHQPFYGLDGRCLAGSVAAEQRYDFPGVNLKAYSMQHMAETVETVNIVDLKYHMAPYTPRTASPPK